MSTSHKVKVFASLITIIVPGINPEDVDSIPLWIAIIMSVLVLAVGLLLILGILAYLA